jgi:hypothetical protein
LRPTFAPRDSPSGRSHLGDVDDAFAWLEIAVREGATGLLLLRVHPRLDPIRQDARYWPLVERVGLADTDANR